jgi:hypothetical protein
MYFKLKWFWDFYSYQEVMGLIINNNKNTELICTHTEKISKPVIIFFTYFSTSVYKWVQNQIW